MTLTTRIAKLERAQHPSSDDALPAWRVLFSSTPPTPADVANLVSWLPRVEPLRAFALRLFDAGKLTQFSATDIERVRARATTKQRHTRSKR
jgi:hypothetical protein